MLAITRQDLKILLDSGSRVVLVEVIGPNTFREFHLPGAIRIPVDENFEPEVRAAVPDKDTTVVVYCLDLGCKASPKAARRLDELGYRNVYDYEAGKKDWRAAGLPIETGARRDA